VNALQVYVNSQSVYVNVPSVYVNALSVYVNALSVYVNALLANHRFFVITGKYNIPGGNAAGTEGKNGQY